MTKKQIQNHSFYHVFKVEKEGQKTVLQAKQFLFSKTWTPEAGLKLLKDSEECEPIPSTGIADFRIDSLNLDRVFLDLRKFFMTMDMERRMSLQDSWDKVRKRLESLPRLKDTFEKMEIRDLSQQDHVASFKVPDHFSHLTDEVEVPELQGEIFPESIDEADFTSQFAVGLDVAVYTVLKSRPWVGRITRRLSEDTFQICWFKKQPRSTKYVATEQFDVIEDASVILWGFSSERTENSFNISSVYFLRLKKLYEEHDVFMAD